MILRTTFSDGSQSNNYLGRHYQLVLSRISPERFKEIAKQVFPTNTAEATKDAFGFVIYDCAKQFETLYVSQEHAILSDNGQVFDPLSI